MKENGIDQIDSQIHYKSLVRQAWDKYQEGNYSEMEKALKQSLEFSPYITTETISNWITNFTQFASEHNYKFDTDLFTESTNWNNLISFSLFESKTQEDKYIQPFYLWSSQAERSLTDKAQWITLLIEPETIYKLEGQTASKQLDASKKALIQIQFLDRLQQLIPSPYQGLSNSNKLGSFIYLPVNSQNLSPFNIQLCTPAAAKYVKLGFRSWYSKTPVVLASQLKLEQKSKLVFIPKFKPPEVQPNSNLIIATLLDSFSEACFKYEANIVPVDKSNWKQQFEHWQPSFFFAESIWRGNNGEWMGAMTKYKEKKNNPLREILNFCKQKGIKTVFWNKEDPPNFDLFIDAAQDFDYIFTVDENCIDAYQKTCGHNQVYSLPFAAQPYIHNPGGKPKELKEICFAGSWFANKHPDRRELLPILLDPALYRGLHIFDRMLHENRDDYRFPEKYQQAIVGTLDLEQVLMAYRSYKVFLNVNTVTNSPTMFSRRVFELLACGTPVISTKSLGVQKLLGDFVKITHSYTETNEHIDVLLNDEEVRQKLAHTGYRYVHENHTYKHRLEYILRKLQIKDKSLLTQPLVSVVAATNRPEYLENCLENYTRQKYTHKELLLVLNNNSYNLEEVRQKVSSLPNVKVFQVNEEKTLGECLNLGVDNSRGDYIAKFDDDDLYGSHFLGDMILAFSYTNAAIVGKQTYYGYLEDCEKLVIRFPGREHRYTNLVSGGTMVIKRKVFEQVRFPYKPFGTDTAFLKSCVESKLKIWSSDKYNFVQKRKLDTSYHTWKINEAEYIKNSIIVGKRLDISTLMI
ncbi:MAG: glycosyltransferase [Okeania sp. SIO1H6]|nr:glycosyltransferase [Okeania sp. SIO1H6]